MHAVPRAFASSYCDAAVAEMDGEARYQTMHTHRCTGVHGSLLGVVTHSCKCSASFYFLEDMLDLVVSKLLARETHIDVTPLDSAARDYIFGSPKTPPIDHPI